MNSRMFALLERAGVRWPVLAHAPTQRPVLEIVQDCVLLRNDWEANRPVTIADCFDKTGFESFINHDHLSYLKTKESLISWLEYAATLREALMPLTKERVFRVILSLSEDDGDCTVRFLQIRPGETSSSDNLERLGEWPSNHPESWQKET
jgi:hypothetical protein